MTQVDLPGMTEVDEGRGRPGFGRVLLVVALLLVGLAGAAVATVAVGQRGEVLPGTTVLGVDIGGRTPEEAGAILAPVAQERTSRPITLTLGGTTFPVTPGQLGYTIDVPGTVDDAFGLGRDGSPWEAVRTRATSLWTPRTVEARDSLDEAALSALVDDIARQVDGQPDPGAVGIDPAGPTVTSRPPADGRILRREEVAEALRAALASDAVTVALAVDITPSPTPEGEIRAAADRARAALAAPLTLSGDAGSLVIAPRQLAAALGATFDDADGGRTVRLTVDPVVLETALADELDRLDSPARSAVVDVPRTAGSLSTQGDASFRPVPVTASVFTPSVPGRAVDRVALAGTLEQMVAEGRATGPLTVVVSPPAVTTEQAAGVNALLGTFTTFHACCEVRVDNIHLMADAIDGVVVAPGASFSINDFIGPRTTAKGYRGAPTIIDGELEDTVGGGVSQFATTMFNAVFFAGLTIDEHKAHSFYIGRYPAGREATVNFPGVDLRWTNNTGAAVAVRTAYTETAITVSVYGQATDRVVSAVTGARRPFAGGTFQIAVDRVITSPDGTQVTETFRTRYNRPPEED